MINYFFTTPVSCMVCNDGKPSLHLGRYEHKVVGLFIKLPLLSIQGLHWHFRKYHLYAIPLSTPSKVCQNLTA